jgi:hypothetical protein
MSKLTARLMTEVADARVSISSSYFRLWSAAQRAADLAESSAGGLNRTCQGDATGRPCGDERDAHDTAVRRPPVSGEVWGNRAPWVSITVA